MNEGRRREEILRAAARLVERLGPAKTTVADVAREAQIGVGTVYLEFPSKEAIVEALSSARYRAVLEAMKLAAAGPGSCGERVCAVLEARTEMLLRLAEGGAHACDLVHCMSPAVAAAKDRFAERERELLADLLRRGARSGELFAADPEMLTDTILRAYNVFAAPALYGLPTNEVGPALKAMRELVLKGLLSRTGP
jgi:AcrR family transcriptional regulator